MRVETKRFKWEGAVETAEQIRVWTAGAIQRPSEEAMRELAPAVGGYDDARLRDLTNRFDATEAPRDSLRVELRGQPQNGSIAAIDDLALDRADVLRPHRP